MRFTIFQFQMSSAHADIINDVGWSQAISENPEIMIHREVKYEGSDEFRGWMFNHYRPVANVNGASNLEDVFHVGNGMSREGVVIERVADRMHSVSVGDIVLCHDTDTYFMVDPMGWTAVDIQEAA